MKFSLVLCTLGRTDVLERAIESISAQTYCNFELIVVDQNPDDRLKDIIKKYENSMTIMHIRSSLKGLSANRNLGLLSASGDVVAFPDDDCEYLPDTLQRINSSFEKYGVDVLAINVKDLNEDIFFNRIREIVKLDEYNFLPYGISIGIFVRWKNKSDVSFDEELGAGRYFGASEESDMLSSLISKGYFSLYDGMQYVLHPMGDIKLPYDKIRLRYINYNRGFGAFYKKEIFLRNKYRLLAKFILELFLRFIGGVVPNSKRHFLWLSCKSRFEGFIQYKYKNRL